MEIDINENFNFHIKGTNKNPLFSTKGFQRLCNIIEMTDLNPLIDELKPEYKVIDENNEVYITKSGLYYMLLKIIFKLKNEITKKAVDFIGDYIKDFIK